MENIEEIDMKKVDICAKVLVRECLQTNTETLSYTLTGFTVRGVPHGDWLVKVSRKKSKK